MLSSMSLRRTPQRSPFGSQFLGGAGRLSTPYGTMCGTRRACRWPATYSDMQSFQMERLFLSPRVCPEATTADQPKLCPGKVTKYNTKEESAKSIHSTISANTRYEPQ